MVFQAERGQRDLVDVLIRIHPNVLERIFKLLHVRRKQFRLHVHGCFRIPHAAVVNVDDLLHFNGNYSPRCCTQ